MKNLEILKKAFEMCGYNCEFEEEDGKLRVRVSLFGCINEFVFGATYDEDVELDYVISSLKVDFDYNETVCNEEGWFTTYMMEKYCERPENNGVYACENIIESWKLEKDGIKIEWDNFENSLGKWIEKLQESYEIDAEYGIDWDEIPDLTNKGWQMFIMMCAGDMCAFEGTIVDSLIEELEEDEKVDKYIMKETEDGNVYLVKTTNDRVLCLNHLC